MKPITFTVYGKPVTQPRQRFNRHTGTAYTPDNGIVAYREAIALAAKAAGATPTTEPVTLIVDWVFVRPKSHYKANGELNRRTALPLPPGDTSNYLKGLEDALNGIAYVDDEQIGKTIMEKTYGAEARTTVRIQ